MCSWPLLFEKMVLLISCYRFSAALLLHVQLAAKIVQEMCFGRSQAQKVDLALHYLAGYISWLRPSARAKFIARVQHADGDDSPELFLKMWRAIWTLAEQAAHCSSRLAQLFHRELTFGSFSPLFILCASADPQRASVDLEVGEAFVRSFTAGLKEVEQGTINFDDLDECAERDGESRKIQPSNDSHINFPPVRSASETPYRKTFREPEGLASFVVALRNYFSILHYNCFVALSAWYWSLPGDASLTSFLWLDAALSGVYVILEIVSRMLVFGVTNKFCGFCLLNARQRVSNLIMLPISLAYFPIVYLFRIPLEKCSLAIRPLLGCD